jgi:hypothetical protein
MKTEDVSGSYDRSSYLSGGHPLLVTNRSRRVVAIVDTMWVGHHPTYFKLICRSFLKEGVDVIALCPRPVEVEQWAEGYLAPETRSRLVCFPLAELWEMRTGWDSIRSVGKATLTALTRWLMLRGALDRIADASGRRPDFIFFPKADGWIAGMSWSWARRQLLPCQWAGIYFHPEHRRPTKRKHSVLEEFLLQTRVFVPDAALGCRRCSFVGLLDENLREVFEARFTKPAYSFPDITDETPPNHDHPLAREIIKRAAGRKVIGLLGGLDERKGLLSLLEVARRDQSHRWFFVFAGRVDYGGANAMVEKLKASQDYRLANCFFHLERLEDGEEFNSVANACDALYAVYNDFPYSSNILTKAAMLQKPVLVNIGALLEERVKKYRTGIAINGDAIPAIQSALDKVLSPSFDALKPAYEEYFAAHSTETLQTTITNLVAQVTPSATATIKREEPTWSKPVV